MEELQPQVPAPLPWHRADVSTFSIDEVLELARHIEQRGRRFYQLAADSAVDEDSRSIFLELATMEGDHDQVFSSMQHHAAPASHYNGLHFKAVAHALLENIESDLGERFSGKQDRREILNEAMAFEKDTIIFCLTLKEMLASATDRANLDRIIQEELGHLILLGSRLATAK